MLDLKAIEMVAAVSGLACVYLTVRQNVFCWPVGLLQTILYVYLFYKVRLYSDSLLNIVFVLMQVHGWYNWLYGGKDKGILRVSLLTPGRRIAWAGVIVAASSGLGFLMRSYTDADMAYPDALITVMSLCAQWLMNEKKLECWILWISVDILSIGVFGMKGLYTTTLLYATFLFLAYRGFIAWRKDPALQNTELS